MPPAQAELARVPGGTHNTMWRRREVLAAALGFLAGDGAWRTHMHMRLAAQVTEEMYTALVPMCWRWALTR